MLKVKNFLLGLAVIIPVGGCFLAANSLQDVIDHKDYSEFLLGIGLCLITPLIGGVWLWYSSRRTKLLAEKPASSLVEKKRKRKWPYVILYGTFALFVLLGLVGIVGEQLQKKKYNIPQGEYYQYGTASIGVGKIGSSTWVSNNTQCAADLTTPTINLIAKCSSDASKTCALHIHAVVIHNSGGSWGSTWEDGAGGSWNPISVQLKAGEEQTYAIRDNCLCCWKNSNPPKRLVLAISAPDNSEPDVELTFPLSP